MKVAKPVFIINPAARRCPPDVEQVIRHACPEAEVVFTRAAGHAATLAREAVERVGASGLVVVGGGDGTFREVAGAVGDRCRMGVLPLGTVNQLSRQLGVPRKLEEALALLDGAQTRTIYAGWCRLDGEAQGQPFFIGVSAGLDAASVHGVRSSVKKAVGSAAYALSGLEQLFKPLVRVRWQVDEKKGIGSQLIVLRNGIYGGLMKMSDTVGPETPGLDTVVVDGGRLAVLFFFLRSLLSAPPENGWVAHRPGSPVILTRPAAGPFQIDGDPIVARELILEAGTTPIRVLSGNARLL